MIDRGARDLLVRHIEDYLDERTSAFDFDEAIQSIETSDETVQTVIRELWVHYDDCQDHLIVASKAEWDLFQRLVLILKSDCAMRVSRWRDWTPVQRCAALSILLLARVHPSLSLIAALAAPIAQVEAAARGQQLSALLAACRSVASTESSTASGTELAGAYSP